MAGDTPVIVWLRTDLRVADNPALHHATATSAPILPLYVHDTQSKGLRAPGAAQNWFLHHALAGLNDRLTRLGTPLVTAKGAASPVLDRLIAQTGASAVYWNRRHVPAEFELDRAIEDRLKQGGIKVETFRAGLLHEPSHVLSASGQSFKVFTPFWRAFQRTITPRAPCPAPKRIQGFAGAPQSLPLDELGLLPTKPDWAGGLRETWRADEDAAHDVLDEFNRHGLAGYAERRDYPGESHVSRLSPYLRWGVISPYQVWHAVRSAGGTQADEEKFLQEIAWREFWYQLLAHFPDLASRNFHEKFDHYPWVGDSPHLETWKMGKTGYPIVDAGMRQLWETGYMHNRVRMITASFLVKHLMVHWQIGEKWFWDTLIDGDPASNPASWQWVAGSGADGQPFFRIFNPVTQAERFDPSGAYVRRFVPEIAALPDRHLHAPWLAPENVLEQCGIRLGETYPWPVVDHKKARECALRAFRQLGNQG
ncbi:MAG: DNA photolyase family protein [Salaquimonas sp.]|nr:DNA photolyase family protein [Salaquimonas sp.]